VRLISNRLYFDYNATSPLADSVKEFVLKGDFLFGNPSSSHTTGRQADAVVRQARQKILQIFELNEADYKLFFHSGATEGANTVIKGYAKHKKISFFYAGTDHSIMSGIAEELASEGHAVEVFHPDRHGQLLVESLIEKINLKKAQGYFPLLNFTCVNNETGVVWPLSFAMQIKKETGAVIHVDAVQLPGKMDNWHKLLAGLDAYTFSAHKFGGLKSVGLTIYKKDFSFAPLLQGGGQEDGLRAGTVNVLGIYAAELALTSLRKLFDANSLQTAKNYIEQNLTGILGERGEVIGYHSPYRNLNTITFLIYGKRADSLMPAFDLSGMDVSFGSACQAGQVRPNKVLLSMGYSEQQSLSPIRLSFSPFMKLEEAKFFFKEIESVISRFL